MAQWTDMLHWALTFLVIAVLAAVFGFTGIAEAATITAKVLFLIFLMLSLAAVTVGLTQRLRRP